MLLAKSNLFVSNYHTATGSPQLITGIETRISIAKQCGHKANPMFTLLNDSSSSNSWLPLLSQSCIIIKQGCHLVAICKLLLTSPLSLLEGSQKRRSSMATGKQWPCEHCDGWNFEVLLHIVLVQWYCKFKNHWVSSR